MNNRLYLVLCLLFFCISCSEKDEKSEIVRAINEMTPVDYTRLKAVIVIPREGCGSCISNASAYVRNKYDSLEQVVIIFTGVKDKKLVKLQLGNSFFKNKNVIIDEDNKLIRFSVFAIYPKVIFFDKGVIEDIKEFNAENMNLTGLLRSR